MTVNLAQKMRQIWNTLAGWQGILVPLGLAALALVTIGVLTGPVHLAAVRQVTEAWLTSHPEWGIVVFILISAISMSAIIPEAIFGIAAGALFGFVWGTISFCISGLLCALFVFLVTRRFLQTRVQNALPEYPKLQAVEAAVSHGRLRVLCLLRLLPVNPAIMSCILASTRVSLWPYLLTSCCMIPAWILTVYFGCVTTNVANIASGAAELAPLRDTLVIAGLILSVAVMVHITRLAAKQCSQSADIE